MWGSESSLMAQKRILGELWAFTMSFASFHSWIWEQKISSTSHLSVQKINEYVVVFRCLQVLFADPGVSLYHLGRFGRSRRAIVLPIAAFQQKVFCGMIQHHHHHFPVRIWIEEGARLPKDEWTNKPIELRLFKNGLAQFGFPLKLEVIMYLWEKA